MAMWEVQAVDFDQEIVLCGALATVCNKGLARPRDHTFENA